MLQRAMAAVVAPQRVWLSHLLPAVTPKRLGEVGSADFSDLEELGEPASTQHIFPLGDKPNLASLQTKRPQKWVQPNSTHPTITVQPNTRLILFGRLRSSAPCACMTLPAHLVIKSWSVRMIRCFQFQQS
jgi:hypothetical protein